MMSKRKFLRVGMGGAAAVLLAPLFRPALLARSFNLPQTYLQSAGHRYWMKLSYNHGQESRQTRRLVGVALRNMGAIRGKGLGYVYVSFFDQALEAAYRRGRKPASLFALIQQLYDYSLFPQAGVAGGELLFGMLFSLLRGRDGTERGQRVYQIYLAYRAAALEYKNIYRTANDAKTIELARNKRKMWLLEWQKNFKALVDLYAKRQAVLNPNFRVERKMLEGFEPALLPIAQAAPRLVVEQIPGRMMVSWKGGANLQQAPTVRGPWTDTQKSSPATFDLRQQHLFFRTIQPATKASP